MVGRAASGQVHVCIETIKWLRVLEHGPINFTMSHTTTNFGFFGIFFFFYCDALPVTSNTPSPLHVPTDSDKMQKTERWHREEYQKALSQTLVTDELWW